MGDIIFARPRHDYASYRDFWELARLSGFPVIYIDEVDHTDPQKLFIVSSPDASLEWPMEFPESRARIIYWMIEWYKDYQKPKGIDEVWHMDAIFAKEIGAKFVPIGSHPSLGSPPATPARWDVSHLMYLTGRRARVVNSLQKRGLRIAEGGWSSKRAEQLRGSICMLHVHQHDDIPALAPLRAALAAAYQMPLISESFWVSPHLPADAVIHDNIARLASTVYLLCTSGISATVEPAKVLHQTLCYDYSFGKVVKASV